MKLSLAEIAALTGGQLSGGEPTMPIDGITTDSRHTAGGQLFVALQGEHFDGHAFVAAAAAAGASAALVMQPGLEAELPLIRVADPPSRTFIRWGMELARGVIKRPARSAR